MSENKPENKLESEILNEYDKQKIAEGLATFYNELINRATEDLPQHYVFIDTSVRGLAFGIKKIADHISKIKEVQKPTYSFIKNNTQIESYYQQYKANPAEFISDMEEHVTEKLNAAEYEWGAYRQRNDINTKDDIKIWVPKIVGQMVSDSLDYDKVMNERAKELVEEADVKPGDKIMLIDDYIYKGSAANTAKRFLNNQRPDLNVELFSFLAPKPDPTLIGYDVEHNKLTGRGMPVTYGAFDERTDTNPKTIFVDGQPIDINTSVGFEFNNKRKSLDDHFSSKVAASGVQKEERDWIGLFYDGASKIDSISTFENPYKKPFRDAVIKIAEEIINKQKENA